MKGYLLNKSLSRFEMFMSDNPKIVQKIIRKQVGFQKWTSPLRQSSEWSDILEVEACNYANDSMIATKHVWSSYVPVSDLTSVYRVKMKVSGYEC